MQPFNKGPPSPTNVSTPPSSIDQTIDTLFRNKSSLFASGQVAAGTPPITGAAGTQLLGVAGTLPALNPTTPPPAPVTTPAVAPVEKPVVEKPPPKSAEEKQREKERKEKEKKEKEQREKEQKEKEQKEKEQKEAAAAAAAAVVVKEPETEILGKRKLAELLQQISPNEKMDDEVEEILSVLADDFVESVVSFACTLAKHRNSNSLEVKDLQCHLERNWNIRIPGFGNVEQVKLLLPMPPLLPLQIHHRQVQLQLPMPQLH
eukprot:gene13837-16315_t